MGIPIFFKRKLIGHYEGPIEGDESVILTAYPPFQPAPDLHVRQYIFALVLFDERGEKAGLECLWIEGLNHVPGYTPIARERMI